MPEFSICAIGNRKLYLNYIYIYTTGARRLRGLLLFFSFRLCEIPLVRVLRFIYLLVGYNNVQWEKKHGTTEISWKKKMLGIRLLGKQYYNARKKTFRKRIIKKCTTKSIRFSLINRVDVCVLYERVVYNHE